MPTPAPADRPIRAYRARRDFGATPEPRPRRAASAAPIFVVQKHAAHRLHWDFRLEHHGVLLSWAVPKGPSLDPTDKRLAVHVEDHPLDYARFHGVIPAGNYGAGTVEIWDHGTWQPAGDVDQAMAQGELKFSLQGDRLHGRFVLVRLKPRTRERAENWLLIKEHDEAERPGTDAAAMEQQAGEWQPPAGAHRAELPHTQKPMLATAADAPPEGPEWLTEIKFDGYRLLVFKDAASIRVITRNGLDWTHRFPHLACAAARLPANTLLIDGEIVALRPDGKSHFGDLQAALSENRDSALVFYAFDLLFRDGFDFRACPLLQRKQELAALIPAEGPIRFSDHLEGATAAVRQRACAMGLEGIVCKRAASPYRATRSHDWVKVKCLGREEFLVLGFTKPKGSRTGLGAILLGFFDPAGNLHYAGACGSGFGERDLVRLGQTLEAIRTTPPPNLLVTEDGPPAGAAWVRPELVAEVQFTAWSGAGRLRHPVFLGLREDKAAAEIVRDVPDPEAPRRHIDGAKPSPLVHARKPAWAAREIAGIRLTHPERELWPGITKAQLAGYWQAVAAEALPEIGGRPLALVRCPDGIGGQHFFQKHAHRGMPTTLHEGEHDGAPYLALDGEAGLLACAQMAAIELHGWGSRLPDPGHADRLVFDLDPGEGVDWPAVIHAALELRQRLEAAGLASFPRTSGGKGLHLVVPLRPRAGWDAVRKWCRGFAETLARESPDRYVAAVPKARRQGRILIDWLRNGLGSTAVCSYSPRARDGATVAMKLSWREVTPRLDPNVFTVLTVPQHLGRRRRDPWEGWALAARELPDG